MRVTLLLLLALSLSCQKKAVDFSSLYAIKSHFDEKNSMLVVDISLDKSIHAYALGEKIGIPIELSISPKNGWETAGQVELPLGKTKKLSLGESVVLEGNIEIRQKLKKGSGPGEASLHLQVCSETACDRPRIHPLIFQ